MASNLAQDTRIGSFTCELGENVLVIERFEGSEGLSEFFEYRLDVLTEERNIDFDKILGTNCCLSMKSKHEGVKRHFNGVLVESQWNGQVVDLTSYRLVLRPWLWLLTKTSSCRIFHEKPVNEIIKAVFGKHSFAKIKDKLTKSYPKLEYCVQYCESDYAFVARLMEEYGIYYYFEHNENGHELVLADAASCHAAKLGGASLSHFGSNVDSARGLDTINEWVPSRRFRSGKFSLKDYDYHVPAKAMLSEGEAAEKYANASLEIYSYPGRYVERKDGTALAKVRLEAEQALDKRAIAEGDSVTCCPGFTMELKDISDRGLQGKYLTVRANHVYRTGSYRAGQGGGSEGCFGRYEFLPCDIPFRAPAVTPKPRIFGPQTAVVVSEVDEKCRIKVKFHWQKEDGESRYVRISHGWAGASWGDLKIPRKDMEVIVEYLDGDPDQPMVTGCVYNGTNKAPYDLPTDKTISGTKSKTYDGSGYNEFIMDDRSGSQLIRMHAEKDVKVKIKNDRDDDIGNVWTAEAKTKIQLKVGQSTITMTPTEIEIKSVNIKITADATIDAKATASIQIVSKGLGTLKGEAMQIVKGGVVLIN